MSLDNFQRRRRLALAVLLATAVAVLCVVQSAWDQTTHDLIEALGLGLIVVGILGRVWCTLYIGGRKSAEIVTAGPYSVTRNPLYVFSAVAAAGVGAQTGSLVVALVFMLGCTLAFLVVIRREERFLEVQFGDTYRVYKRAVPRFWPRPRLFKDATELLVRPRRIYATLSDGIVFFIAKPLLELVEYLQHNGTLPSLAYLY